MSTLLLRAGSDEAAHAPEFQYLRSWVELQARRALGELRIPDGSADDEGLTDPADRALVVAHERVLVTARTLDRLAAALDEASVDAAAPRAAAEVLPALHAERASDERAEPVPLYTLRGFERLEERVGGERSRQETTRTLPPVVLFTRAGLERALGEVGAADWRRLARGETPPATDLHLLRTGLYHEFIDYYGVVRSDVLPHVPRGARRILEVGCGRGATGELLRRERGAQVTGVELNPVVARAAATRLDRVVVGDIEDPALDADLGHGEPYDLVLALELFEHLARPERFLQRVARLVAPEGSILLSVPNVGHYSVVEDLLAGRWDYLPIGLLCYTHLRFFTRRTLEDWLERLGFDRYRLIPQRTEESPRLAAWLEASSEAGDGGPELDRESLRTQGFFVSIHPEPSRWNRPKADT